MIEPFCPHPVILQQLYTGPFRTSIDAFAHQLLHQGYASWTTKETMRLLADLSSWLQRHTLLATDLNAQRMHAFLHDRSQRCRAHREDRAALRRLLAHLREQGVMPIPMVEIDRGLHSHMACDFQHSLLHQRCLVPRTVQSSLDTVQRFLGSRFGALPLRLEGEGLCARDVTAFMVQQAQHYSPTRAKVIATALRSFCRFVLQHGASPHDLAHAVPTVPNWRLSPLPKCRKAEDVACLWQSCERRTPHGQRDDAMVLLLARLGLRAGAVVALPLDDRDWDAGELRIQSTGARQDRLPLPHDVGDAFVASLRGGRPPSATRQVFVRRRAPRRGFANRQAVSTIVRRALARAGRHPALQGAPLLRHALATDLLHHGAARAAIGARLRHRPGETTRIDAKVAQDAVRALALPWPGGAL